jgi:hypothetical protein
MGMNRELDKPLSIAGVPLGSRRYWVDMSQHLPRLDPNVPVRKQPINWDKVLGLAMVVVVVGLYWTAIGIVISRFLR